jgi:ABC-type multidrug transport system fused ATPase/permease subunit
VMDAMEGLRGTRTIIVVAHRHHTIARCDPLFVLDAGRLVRVELRTGRLAPPRHATVAS